MKPYVTLKVPLCHIMAQVKIIIIIIGTDILEYGTGQNLQSTLSLMAKSSYLARPILAKLSIHGSALTRSSS